MPHLTPTFINLHGTNAMDYLDDLSNRSHSNSSESSDCGNPSLYQQISGSIIFVIIWPLIVMDFKRFPIGRPAAALLGAVLMVLFHVINQPRVYQIEGESSNLQTIFLLIGMMILSYYFDREGLLTILSVKMFGKSFQLRNILWRVCVLSAVLSAFITNDAACLLIAPLVLNIYAKQNSDPKELLPLTLGIATSANIGSAATIFGNPQNVLIASSPAGVNLIDFIIAEMPVAIFALLINIGLLHLLFCRVIFRTSTTSVEHGEQERLVASESETVATTSSIVHSRLGTSLTYDSSRNPYQSSQIARERELSHSETYQSTSTNTLPRSLEVRHSLTQSGQERLMESVTANINNVIPLKERSNAEKVFAAWLFLISALSFIALAINSPQLRKHHVYFNLGLVPVGAAVLTMLVDSIVNKKYQQDSMLKIDWTVILMFMGIFIWIEGFKSTCIPKIIFNKLKKYMNLTNPEGIIFFTIFVLIGSNIFSNVPLVILLKDRLDGLCGSDGCDKPKIGALLLAWISTIAGNLTLIGSIANLIVAEKAKKSDAKYDLSFLRYLPYGIISTVTITVTTVPLVYLLGKLASKI